MPDILKELRERCFPEDEANTLIRRAGDEIEKLRAALEPFARKRSSEMMSPEELDVDQPDIDRARLALGLEP